MPAYFNEGVFVEKNAWHRMGRIVTADEAAAMTRSEWAVASGHDYTVIAVPNGNLERQPLTEAEFRSMSAVDAIRFNDAVGRYGSHITIIEVARAKGQPPTAEHQRLIDRHHALMDRT